jgi:rhamnosyltransferase
VEGSGPGEGNVCAVVVTHYPSPEWLDCLELLTAEFAHVVVIDNGSDAGSQSLLDRAEASAEVLRLTRNTGIAHALNVGCERATSAGYPWVATFDQDSRIPSGYLRAMERGYLSLPDPERIAILSPRYRDPKTGRTVSFANGDKSSADAIAREVRVTMTSGSILAASTLSSVGPFDESLFIDLVDTDYCFRCRGAGLRLVEVQDAVLEHRLGRAREHDFLGGRVVATHHPAERRYYSSRNRVVIYRRYLWQEPAWVVVDAWTFMKELVKIVLLEEDRGRKLRSTARGIGDGIRGRLSPQASAEA